MPPIAGVSPTTVSTSPKRADEVFEPAGVNLLNACGEAAWQTVFHFHVHVIPRYEDDPLRLPWRPQPGDPDEIAGAAAALRGEG